MDNMDFDFIPVPLVSTEAPEFTATALAASTGTVSTGAIEPSEQLVESAAEFGT